MFVPGHNNSEYNHPYLKPHANIPLENSALFAKMKAFAKWVKTLEAEKAVEAAKCKAWKNFFAQFLNAGKSKFEAQVYFENEKDQ